MPGPNSFKNVVSDSIASDARNRNGFRGSLMSLYAGSRAEIMAACSSLRPTIARCELFGVL